MVKIVADANVIISAYVFGGNPARVIDKALTGEIEMVISDPIAEEVRRVLSDKFHWPQEALKELESVIDSYARKVHPVETVEEVNEDPPDNRVLECAFEAKADFIVTGDRDLLRRERFRNILILRPADFLRAMEPSRAR